MEVESRNSKSEQLEKVFRGQKREIRIDSKLYQADIPLELSNELKDSFLQNSKDRYRKLGFSPRFLNSKLSTEEIDDYLKSVSELVRDTMSDKGGLIANSTQSLQERALEFLHSMNYSTIKAKFFLAFPTLLIYQKIKPLHFSEDEMEEQLQKFMERMKKSKNVEYEKWKTEFQEAISKRIPLNKLHSFLETMKVNRFEMPESVKEPFEKVSKFSKEIKIISYERTSLEKLILLKQESESYNIVTSEMVAFEENVNKSLTWFTTAETIFSENKISWKIIQQLVLEYKTLPLQYERIQELKSLYEESQKIFSLIPVASRATSSKSRYPTNGTRINLAEISKLAREAKNSKVYYEDFEELYSNLQKTQELTENVRMLIEDSRTEKTLKLISNLFKELSTLPYKTEMEELLQEWIDYLSLIEKVKKNLNNYQKLSELIFDLEEANYRPEFGPEIYGIKQKAVSTLKWFDIYNSLIDQKSKRIDQVEKIQNSTETFAFTLSSVNFPEPGKLQELSSTMIDQEELQNFLNENQDKTFHSQLQEEMDCFLKWKERLENIKDLSSFLDSVFSGLKLSIKSNELKNLIDRLSTFKLWKKRYSKNLKNFKDLKELRFCEDSLIQSSEEFREVELEFQKATEWKNKAKQMLNGDSSPNEIEELLYSNKSICKPQKILTKLEEVLKSQSSFQEIHELLNSQSIHKSQLKFEQDVFSIENKLEELQAREFLLVDCFYDEFGFILKEMFNYVLETINSRTAKIPFNKANKIQNDLKKSSFKSQSDKFSYEIEVFLEHFESIFDLNEKIEEILTIECKKKGKKSNGASPLSNFDFYFKFPRFLCLLNNAITYPIELNCIDECLKFIQQIEFAINMSKKLFHGELNYDELVNSVTKPKFSCYLPEITFLKKNLKWIESWRTPAKNILNQIPKTKLIWKNKDFEKEGLPVTLSSENYIANFNEADCSLIISQKSGPDVIQRTLFSKRPRKQNKSLQDSIIYSIKDDPFGKPRKKQKLITGDLRFHQTYLKEENSDEIYCFCRKGFDNITYMIQCDCCSEWFHGDCIGIKESTAKKIPKWHCACCSDRFDLPYCGKSDKAKKISFEIFRNLLNEGLSLSVRPPEMNEFEELFQTIEKWVFLARKEVRNGVDYQCIMNKTDSKRNSLLMDLLLQYHSFPVEFQEYMQLIHLQKKRDFINEIQRENIKQIKRILDKDISFLNLEEDPDMFQFYQRAKFLLENQSSIKKVLKQEQESQLHEWELELQHLFKTKADINDFQRLKLKHEKLPQKSIMFDGLCDIIQKAEIWVRGLYDYFNHNKPKHLKKVLIEDAKNIPCGLPYIESLLNDEI